MAALAGKGGGMTYVNLPTLWPIYGLADPARLAAFVWVLTC